jgi:hypothetical protein
MATEAGISRAEEAAALIDRYLAADERAEEATRGADPVHDSELPREY